MGIEQRTGCFQKLWSNHLLRIEDKRERREERAPDFTVNRDNREDVLRD
jgi:hypothetical protein